MELDERGKRIPAMEVKMSDMSKEALLESGISPVSESLFKISNAGGNMSLRVTKTKISIENQGQRENEGENFTF